MARTLIEEEYVSKRNEILDVALRLVYTKGFEQMAIQDILKELQISKGAFYHYFDSKQALLEALIDRLQQEALQTLTPILSDPQLTALEKLQGYISSGASWKAERKAMMRQLIRVWYADENALVRQKVFSRSIQKVAPLLAGIVRQGIAEGVFCTAYPEQVAEFIIILLQGMAEAFADLFLKTLPDEANGFRDRSWQRIKVTFEAYTEALERVLGAAPGSVQLIDVDSLQEWLV